MSDNKRIWSAAILITILSVCLIRRGCTPDAQPSLPPLDYREATDISANEIATDTTEDIQQDEITSETDTVTDMQTTVVAEEYQMTASQPYLSKTKYEEICARVIQLHEEIPDFIGWLYMADSDIDYPVVQGNDNQYYLTHAPDGSYYYQGTLFLDCHCNRDLSDKTNIIFGHNMQKGMFGDIRSFRTTEQFEMHRYGWFFTTEKIYRIDFFGLSIVSAYDELYDVPCPFTEWTERLIENAQFYRDVPLTDSDMVVAFSTCAGDFDNARALFSGALMEMTNESDFVK